jgi:hypothetical protein
MQPCEHPVRAPVPGALGEDGKCTCLVVVAQQAPAATDDVMPPKGVVLYDAAFARKHVLTSSAREAHVWALTVVSDASRAATTTTATRIFSFFKIQQTSTPTSLVSWYPTG